MALTMMLVTAGCPHSPMAYRRPREWLVRTRRAERIWAQSFHQGLPDGPPTSHLCTDSKDVGTKISFRLDSGLPLAAHRSRPTAETDVRVGPSVPGTGGRFGPRNLSRRWRTGGPVGLYFIPKSTFAFGWPPIFGAKPRRTDMQIIAGVMNDTSESGFGVLVPANSVGVVRVVDAGLGDETRQREILKSADHRWRKNPSQVSLRGVR